METKSSRRAAAYSAKEKIFTFIAERCSLGRTTARAEAYPAVSPEPNQPRSSTIVTWSTRAK